MIDTLEADGIWLEFNGRRILSDIYIQCETGKITGLLGRNGAGKTCLMNIIYGTLKNQSKSVRVNSEVIQTPYTKRGLIAFLPQFNFIPKHLSLKRVFSDYKLDFSAFAEIFPELKMHYKSAIKNFSGGERRLVEVYIILKSKSSFCLLDEPFTHLMPVHIEKIKELLSVEKENKGMLITDHMHEHITTLCDSLYLLKEGKAHLLKNTDELERLDYLASLKPASSY